MKRQLTVVLLALVLALSLVACIACQDPEQPATTYTLTYAAGEGSGTAPAVEQYEEGATVTIKANPFTAPEGKEFNGWSDGTNTYQASGTLTMPASNVTLTAQWKTTTVTPQPSKYSVTYKAGEGTGADVVEEYLEGATVTVKSSEIFTAPEGQEFECWIKTNIIGADEEIAVGATFAMPAGDIEITAIWQDIPQPETWTVTFKNGTTTVSTVQVVKGEKLTAGQIPSFTAPEGKVFEGWFVDDTELTVNTAITSDITAIAKLSDKQPATIDMPAKYEGAWYGEATIGFYKSIKSLYILGETAYFYVDAEPDIEEDGDIVVDLTVTMEGQKVVASGLYFETTLDQNINITLTFDSDSELTLTVARGTATNDYDFTNVKGGDEPTPSVTPNKDWAGTFDIVETTLDGDPSDEYVLVIALSADGKTLEITFDDSKIVDAKLAVVSDNQQLTFESYYMEFIITLGSDGSFTMIESDEMYNYEITKRGEGGDEPALTPEAFVGIYDLEDDAYGYIYVLTVTLSDDDKLNVLFVENEDGEITEYDVKNINLSWVDGKQVLSFDSNYNCSCNYTLILNADGSFEMYEDDEMEIYVDKRADDPTPPTPIQYTVTFDPNNEGDVWTVKVNEGQSVAKPAAAPTHPDGKTFRYWMDENGDEFNFSAAITADVTIYAAYGWKVTFLSGEGATGTIDAQWVKIWNARGITLPDSTGLSNGNKVFAGWSDGKDTYQAGDNYVGQGNVTLTALWKDAQTQKYTVTYIKSTTASQIDSIIGEVPAVAEVAEGTKITVPEASTLSLDHYTLTAWRVYVFVVEGSEGDWQVLYDSQNKAVNVAPGAEYTMIGKNIQFRGVWTANTVTISFDANGGSGEMADVTSKLFNSTYFLPDCGFTAPEGKTFEGWSTSANGYILGGGLKLDASVVSAQDTVTLYAIWKSAAVVPSTPLIDDIKGSWNGTNHAFDIVAGTDATNESVKGYAVLDGKTLLVIADFEGAYYAYSLDDALSYTVSLSGDALTLTPYEGAAIVLGGKTELVNADRAIFEGNWSKLLTNSTQPWVITSDAVYYGINLTKASLGIVIGNHFAIAYESVGYNYVYVLAKQGDNLEGWYTAPEKNPVETTFAPGEFVTLTVEGELNQMVGNGAAPDATKIETPVAPDGQVFSKWVIAGTETEFDLTAAMTSNVSIVAMFVEGGGTESAKKFVGNITVQDIFNATYTFTAFEVDFESLTATGTISSGDECTITFTNAKYPSYKPSTYGDSSSYYDVTIFVGIHTFNLHFVVNAEQTKLTVCNDDDEVLNNGEFILQTAETESWQTLSATDVNGSLYNLAKDGDVRLYFAESFTNGGTKFLGIEFNVHSVFGVRIKGVYESNGEEKVPSSYLSNPTQSTENVAWLVYHSNAYDIVIGQKTDGNYYVVSFKYGSSNTEYDKTERILLTEKPGVGGGTELTLADYAGEYTGELDLDEDGYYWYHKITVTDTKISMENYAEGSTEDYTMTEDATGENLIATYTRTTSSGTTTITVTFISDTQFTIHYVDTYDGSDATAMFTKVA